MTATQTTSPAWIVWITAPRSCAGDLTRTIVEQRLAACVQQMPVQATYHWDGALCSEEEILLLCKTTAAAYPALESWIAEHHPYTNPQVLATPACAARPDYLLWLNEATRPL